MSEQNGFSKDSYERLAHQQQQSNPIPQMRVIAGKLERLDQTIEEMQREWKQRDPREELRDLSEKHVRLSSSFERVEERLEEQERTLSTYLSWISAEHLHD